jgi:hypothetical protein
VLSAILLLLVLLGLTGWLSWLSTAVGIDLVTAVETGVGGATAATDAVVAGLE